MAKYTIFIGYDDREPLMYEILRHSLSHNCGEDVEILPLKHEDFRKAGVFSHEFTYDKTGNLFNEKDVTKEFTNNRWTYYMYTRTRFYLPMYCKKKKITGQVLYLDPNFFCLPSTDIRHLFQWAERNNDFISVCKDVKNHMKRSGCVLYNMDNPLMNKFNLHQNKSTLNALAKFSWVEENPKYRDSNITDLPKAWFQEHTSEEEVQRLVRFQRCPIEYTSPKKSLWIDEYFSYLVDRLVPEAENM